MQVDFYRKGGFGVMDPIIGLIVIYLVFLAGVIFGAVFGSE